MPNLGGLPNLSSISKSNFSSGWVFAILATIMVLLFGLSIGRTRAVISLLSLYVALVLELIFPFWQNIGSLAGDRTDKYLLELGLFIIAYGVVFTVFNLSFIRKRVSSGEFSLPAIMILSALQLGFAISVIFNILPSELAMRWSFGLYPYLGNQMALFFWALAPMPILLFISRK